MCPFLPNKGAVPGGGEMKGKQQVAKVPKWVVVGAKDQVLKRREEKSPFEGARRGE